MPKNDYLLKRAEEIVDELVTLMFLLSSTSSGNPEQMVVDSFNLKILSEQQKKLKIVLRRKKCNLSLIKDIITTIIAKTIVILIEKINTTSLYELRSNDSIERRITAMKIGKSIKFIRITKNLSQKELAEKIEISQNYLSLIENDKKEPSFALLNKISNDLDVPLSAMIVDFDFEKMTPEQQTILYRIKDLIIQLESLHDGIKNG